VILSLRCESHCCQWGEYQKCDSPCYQIRKVIIATKRFNFGKGFLLSGPLNAGSGSGENTFFGTPSKGGPTKRLGTKTERLTVAEWLWFGLEVLICSVDKSDTSEKDKNLGVIGGPRAPFCHTVPNISFCSLLSQSLHIATNRTVTLNCSFLNMKLDILLSQEKSSSRFELCLL
jgi:hypothetical protein